MLAYVFWHQRINEVAREEYQEKLVAFHQILQERQSQGFAFSFVLELDQLAWMPKSNEVYEEWYLVENSAALDPLDEAAVTGICREPHNQVARLASYGTGGLYTLKNETIDPAQVAAIRSASWFSKPTGMSYAKLFELLSQKPDVQQGILWQRKMTMAPAPEFCVHHSQKNLLAEEFQGVQVTTQPIYVPGH